MLRVDYEALAAGSKTLQDQGAIFEECIDRMRQVIEGLPDVWEADTSKRYVEQFQEAEPGLRNVRQILHRQIVIWLDKCNISNRVKEEAAKNGGFSKRKGGKCIWKDRKICSPNQG